jgi:hypothetical protein
LYRYTEVIYGGAGGAGGAGADGRANPPWAPCAVPWIFPCNFFLVEEVALLGDAIEALVEAADNLEITITGDDGKEVGPLYTLNPVDP